MARNLPIFKDQFECWGGHHCVMCRSTQPEGFRFRSMMAGIFELPPQDGSPCGWSCPRGQPPDCTAGKATPPTPKDYKEGGCGCSPPVE